MRLRFIHIAGVVLVAAGLVTALTSFYTIKEGNVGIVKRWGEAVAQVDPGLHFKVPFADSVEEIEVRQRKNVEKLAAATANQLQLDATVSINWTVHKKSAMELFVKYGGLEQFENRVIDPNMRSAAKAALSKFTAVQLIRNREQVVTSIRESIAQVLQGYPIAINSTQMENYRLPEQYRLSIEAKEKAYQDALKENHNLTKQKLVAQRVVQQASADAEAKRIEADAEAYRVTTTANAEAKAIDLVNAQLAKSPRYIDLVKAKQWNGELPRTMLGSSTGTLLSLGSDNTMSSPKRLQARSRAIETQRN